MKHGDRGKQWESELGVALKAASSFRHNQNSEKSVCDYLAIYRGFGVILEAKEVHGTSIAFSAMTPKEIRELNDLAKKDGLGLVAIKQCGPNWSRAWVVTWKDWCHLQLTLARKSIPLADGERPACLTEITKFSRPQGLGRAWDLRDILDYHLYEWAERVLADSGRIIGRAV